MKRECVFAYGTLTYPDVAAAVTGRRLEGVAARLHGFARYQVRDAPFPGIVPAAGHSVAGVAYPDIDPATLRRIDAFEGRMYRRERVTVQLEHGDAAWSAQAYVVRPRWRTALAGWDWDEAGFVRDWLAAYAGRR